MMENSRGREGQLVQGVPATMPAGENGDVVGTFLAVNCSSVEWSGSTRLVARGLGPISLISRILSSYAFFAFRFVGSLPG